MQKRVNLRLQRLQSCMFAGWGNESMMSQIYSITYIPIASISMMQSIFSYMLIPRECMGDVNDLLSTLCIKWGDFANFVMLV